MAKLTEPTDVALAISANVAAALILIALWWLT